MHMGRSLRLYLVDGSPNGLITAEIMNWTGHVLSGPRSLLADLVKRPETARTGVYFLIGPDADNPSRNLAYIGETDDVANRLRQHNRPENKGGKDFWEKVCVVTSKDHNLTKAHVKFLESALIETTRCAGKAVLVNGNEPSYKMLPEADIADMRYFLDQISVVLPVLGFGFLRARPKISNAESGETTHGTGPTFCMEVHKHGVRAEAREYESDFVVLEGSTTREHWVSKHAGYRALYEELVEDGVLSVPHDGNRKFTEDYAFSSPSAAAAVVSGRPANGRTSWQTSNGGQTYADWKDVQALPKEVQTSSGNDVMGIF